MARVSGRAVPLLLLAGVVIGCGRTPPVELQAPFTVAVVRGDGYFVPFATYADGIWSGPPIEAGSPYGDRATLVDRDAPWFGGELAAPGQWDVRYPLPWHLPAFGEPREANAATASADPVSIRSHCGEVWAVQSDLDAEPAPPYTVHRVEAAAFSAPVTANAVAELSVEPGLSEAAHDVLRATFDAAEAAEAARRERDGRYLSRPYGAEAATAPLTFTHLFRVGRHDDHDVYWFEAQRTYASAAVPDLPGCELATVMSGWLVESPWGGFTILSHDLAMTSCLRMGSPRLQPLVTLSADDRLYSLVVAHHYEGETYHVFEVEHDAVREVLDVLGGGC